MSCPIKTPGMDADAEFQRSVQKQLNASLESMMLPSASTTISGGARGGGTFWRAWAERTTTMVLLSIIALGAYHGYYAHRLDYVDALCFPSGMQDRIGPIGKVVQTAFNYMFKGTLKFESMSNVQNAYCLLLKYVAFMTQKHSTTMVTSLVSGVLGVSGVTPSETQGVLKVAGIPFLLFWLATCRMFTSIQQFSSILVGMVMNPDKAIATMQVDETEAAVIHMANDAFGQKQLVNMMKELMEMQKAIVATVTNNASTVVESNGSGYVIQGIQEQFDPVIPQFLQMEAARVEKVVVPEFVEITRVIRRSSRILAKENAKENATLKRNRGSAQR